MKNEIVKSIFTLESDNKYLKLNKNIRRELQLLVPSDLNPNIFDQIDESFSDKIEHPGIRHTVKLCLSSLVIVFHQYLFDNIHNDDKIFDVSGEKQNKIVEEDGNQGKKLSKIENHIPTEAAAMFWGELLDEDSYLKRNSFLQNIHQSAYESSSSDYKNPSCMFWKQFVTAGDREKVMNSIARSRSKSKELLLASFLKTNQDFDPIMSIFGTTLDNIITSRGRSLFTYICEQLVLIDFSTINKNGFRECGTFETIRRYGIHYANLPPCEGGFATSSFADTAALWNMIMANSCERKLKLLINQKFSLHNESISESSSLEEEKNGKREFTPPPFHYSLKMLPTHLFYGGKINASFGVLNNAAFRKGRLSCVPKLHECTLSNLSDFERVRQLSKDKNYDFEEERVCIDDCKTSLLFLCNEIKSHVIANKESYDDRDVAHSFYDIARFIQRRNCVVEAMDFYESALEYYRSYHRNFSFGQDSSSRFIPLLYDMGHLFLSVRLFSQGIACFQEVRDSVEVRYGTDHLEVAETLKLLATVYSTVHDLNAAISCYKGALTIESNHLGIEHFQVADTYGCLGRVYVVMNNLDDALSCFEQGLRIAKNTNATESSPQFIAESYNNIGRVYRMNKDYAKAIDAYSEALEWWKVHEPTHNSGPEYIARAMHSIGLIYIEMEHWLKATQMLQSALKQRQTYNTSALYPNNFVTNLFDLGLALDKAGKYNDAINSFNKLIEGIKLRPNYTNINNDNTSCILHNISLCFCKKGDISNAITTFEEVLQTTKATGWKLQSYFFFINSLQQFITFDYTKMIRTFRNMGNVLLNHKQYIEAIDWFKEVATLQRNHMDQNHIEVAKTIKFIAFIYGIVKDSAKVISSYEDVLIIQKAQLGDNNINVAKTYNSLGIVQGMTPSNTSKALSCFKLSLNIAKKVSILPSLFVAELHYNNGMLHMKTKKNQKACDDFSTALAIRKSWIEVKGTDSHKVDLIPILQSLGNIHFSLAQWEKAVSFYAEAIDAGQIALHTTCASQGSLHYQLGITFIRCQNFEEATKYLEAALRIYHRIIGVSQDNSIQVAGVLYHLGKAYSKLFKYSYALQYYMQAVDMYKTQHGNNHIQVANSLLQVGDILMKISEISSRKDHMIEAMKYYEESLSVRQLVLGDDHIDVASTLHYMGLHYLHRVKKYKKAIRSLSRSLSIFQKKLDSTDDHISDSCIHLALSYQGNKKYSLALKYFQEALRVLKLSTEAPSAKIAEAYYRIGLLHTCVLDIDQEKKDIVLSLSDAEYYMKEALSCYRGIGIQDNSPCITNIMLWISYFPTNGTPGSASSSKPILVDKSFEAKVQIVLPCDRKSKFETSDFIFS